jgi:integrase
MSIKKIIATHRGRTIAAGTFDSTYRACVSMFINWSIVHYKDQGFPVLSVSGAIYKGIRKEGINKQRAFRDQELQILFKSVKMQNFALNTDTAHCCWLPLIGLYTGARLNEVCQLNPFTDIQQDSKTGIHYFHFTDDTDTENNVLKSVKTSSSHRIVPIHSKLIELGILEYVESVTEIFRVVVASTVKS